MVHVHAAVVESLYGVLPIMEHNKEDSLVCASCGNGTGLSRKQLKLVKRMQRSAVAWQHGQIADDELDRLNQSFWQDIGGTAVLKPAEIECSGCGRALFADVRRCIYCKTKTT